MPSVGVPDVAAHLSGVYLPDPAASQALGKQPVEPHAEGVDVAACVHIGSDAWPFRYR